MHHLCNSCILDSILEVLHALIEYEAMSKETPHCTYIPTTPLRTFLQAPKAPKGPFYVESIIAKPGEKVDIADEEITALAHIIFNAYLEWKKL